MTRFAMVALLTVALAAQPPYARTISDFSEPSGEFDTDNLISNEKAFLHVIGSLPQQGGLYIGVGPDQNFSYIAKIQPAIAFLVDIRRDNLLGHLMFRALFEAAKNRSEYLCLLLGRMTPDSPPASIEELVRYLDQAKSPREQFELVAADVQRRVLTYGVELSNNDLKTIRRIHERFWSSGLNLMFESHNRGRQDYYPRLRDLVLGRDAAGQYASYLATEGNYQTVKKLQAEGRIIPLVGNLAGTKTLRRIGDYARANQLTLSAFYVSNVEQYLFRESKSYQRFVENVSALPRNSRSTIIRSCFGPYARGLAPADSYSAQLLESADHLVAAHARGEIRDFRDVVRASTVGR